MKTTKRFIAMTAALTLTACMAMPMASFAAATPGSITFTSQTPGTHTYTAYRIFNGTAAANGMNTSSGATLSDVSWAGTVTLSNFIDALQKNDTFKFGTATNVFAALDKDTATVDDLMGVIDNFTANSTEAKAFAKFVGDNAVTYGFPASKPGSTISKMSDNTTDLPDGYYVISETGFAASTTAGETGGARTNYLLGVYDASAGAEVTVKSDTPTVTKKIQENTKNGGPSWNDVADYCFADSIPFKITGTMPETIADYTSYYYKFTDSWALNQFSIVDGAGGTDNTIDANDFTVTINTGSTGYSIPKGSYTVTPNDTNTGFTLAFNDIRNVTGESDSKVPINADSTVTVEYNLKFGSAADIGTNGNENNVKLTYSNNPNHTGSGGTDNDTTSETPEDTVVAFVYELDVTKYKGSKSTKAGADEARFKLQRLSDGNYAQVDASGNITGWGAIGSAGEVKTDSNGAFKFVGLDDGAYILSESKTPVGYNTMDPLTIYVKGSTVHCNDYKANADHDEASEVLTAIALYHNDDGSGTAVNTNTESLSAGNVSDEIINMPGSSLPSTGGIGTTLFILGGGCAAGIAGIYLISKKKTREEE